MCTGLHVKHRLFLPDFDETWNFLDRFSKYTEIQTFMKIHPVGAESFHEDWRTDGRTWRS